MLRLAVIFSFLFVIGQTYAQSTPLHLSVQNITLSGGSVLISVYDREEYFMDEAHQVYGVVIPVQEKGTLQIDIPDLVFGRYAIAVFHDENNNGSLDKNFLGIPKEPYAFSNNPRVKWSPPGFSETVFDFSPAQPAVQVKLQYWKNMNKQ